MSVISVLFFICMIILKMWVSLDNVMSWQQHKYFQLFALSFLNLHNTTECIKLMITQKKY